jgi:hypothetical protein
VAAPSTTITGTSTADNLTTVTASVVEALGGNDTITLSNASDWVKASDGNDSIRLNISAGQTTGQIVKGQDGNDTITVNSALTLTTLGSEIKGGKDNDLIDLQTGASISITNAAKISVGSGNDTIQFKQSSGSVVNTTLKGGDGNDSMVVASGATYAATNLQAGKGKDTITFSGNDSTGSTRISAGSGKDVMTITTGATVGSVLGGNGKDSITVNSGATVTSLFGGGQKDTINLGSIFGGGIVYGDDAAASTSDGADLIGKAALNAAAASTVNGGGGNDTILFSTADLAIKLSGDGGNDSITLLEGDTAASIYGGAGADTISFYAVGDSTANALVDGGTEADQIYIGISTGLKTITADTTVLGGAGDDTISTVGFTTAGSINGGDGADSISIGSAATLVAGTGAVINGGGGSDTISILASAGVGIAGGSSAALLTAFKATIAYQAGDVIKLIDTALAGDSLNGLIALGNTGGFGVAAACAGGPFSSGATAAGITGIAAGDLGVYSNGTDTFFAFGSDNAKALTFVVSGKDLVLNTSTTDSTVAATSSNFSFTLSGTASTGLTITLT